MGKPVMEGPVGGGAERGLAGRQPPPSGRLPAWPRLRGAAAAGDQDTQDARWSPASQLPRQAHTWPVGSPGLRPGGPNPDPWR